MERKKFNLFLEVVTKISARDRKGSFINISDIHLKNSNNIFL